MRTAELNELDQLYLHLDRDDEPWSVHLEVRVDGALDEDALRAAVREAADRHPIARARLGAARGTDVRYRWEIADELVRVPLDVVLATADPALEAARSSLLSTSVPLDEAPPFRLTLAVTPRATP
jgi:hypothetical protein